MKYSNGSGHQENNNKGQNLDPDSHVIIGGMYESGMFGSIDKKSF